MRAALEGLSSADVSAETPFPNAGNGKSLIAASNALLTIAPTSAGSRALITSEPS
jgi:hypothetical protein